MKPANEPFEPESEMHTISQIENPAAEKSVNSTSGGIVTQNITEATSMYLHLLSNSQKLIAVIK